MNDMAARVEEYIAAEFRRYFPHCHEVDVDLRDETIHVDVLFSHPRSCTFIAEIGSDDDWYEFSEDGDPHGLVITLPYPKFLSQEA